MVWAMPRVGRWRVAIAAGAAGAVVCAGTPPSGAAATPPERAGAALTRSLASANAAVDPDVSAVSARLRRAFGAAANDVAVVAHDRVSGRTIAYNADLENCTGSIVKVMVLLALIEERRDAGRPLSPRQRELATRMIHVSDNDATTSLLRQAGGRRSLDRLADSLGMTRTRSASSWGRTSTTAADQARLMSALVGGHAALRADDRNYVLGLMSGVAADQRWGAGSVPADVSTQVKNGWVPLEPRGWRVNSVGHVVGGGRDYTVAMLSLDNASMDTGVDHLDAASRVVYEAFAPAQGADAASAGGNVVPSAPPAALRMVAPHPLW